MRQENFQFLRFFLYGGSSDFSFPSSPVRMQFVQKLRAKVQIGTRPVAAVATERRHFRNKLITVDSSAPHKSINASRAIIHGLFYWGMMDGRENLLAQITFPSDEDDDDFEAVRLLLGSLLTLAIRKPVVNLRPVDIEALI
ncbi:hypothetical protein T03_7174 [Trichinella britovi]|uniref:Uncharacterized protein n=1 Tax=Trichinella britovi TaxID=45882 RepID=A0A0V1CJX9_TRIBR|nr:hypothetical protein T03_7174 [Trichinella britovi]